MVLEYPGADRYVGEGVLKNDKFNEKNRIADHFLRWVYL